MPQRKFPTIIYDEAPEEVELSIDDEGCFDADVDEEEENIQHMSRGRARRRGRESSSQSSSLFRRRRGRTATTTTTSSTSASFVESPEDSNIGESPDVFPSHINLVGEAPEYVTESDDFRRISRWVSRLPRSGRSLYERALRSAISPEAISGGTVGIAFGNGEFEMGPVGISLDGTTRNLSEDLRQLERLARDLNDWSNRRLSELLPSALFRCFASYRARDERWIAANLRSPRTMWRARTLPRTSLSRCVSYLAQELFTREETQATANHYVDCLGEDEMERWRRMRRSTRTLVFRQHSCVFGMARDSRWHGIIRSTQRDVLGGAFGWSISIRVYITATVPASHPEIYRRGTMNVDLVFPFPHAFHFLLEREIRMRGQLLWEGTRASRGQSMSLMWVPFPGDARGLTGPVSMRRWDFRERFPIRRSPRCHGISLCTAAV